MEYRIYGESNVGLRRECNQDSFCYGEFSDNTIFALVCDGIGGGKAGEVASKIASEHLQNCFKSIPVMKSDHDVQEWLETIINDTNDLIFNQASSRFDQKGMGTTLVGFMRYHNNTYVFNVGDSRIYALVQDEFICVTEDHTFVADLLKRGEVSFEEARQHPNRNVLTNALGIWDKVKIDITKINEDYEQLLVCSDGLHGYVDENAIKDVISEKEMLENRIKNLIQLSLNHGGLDNVSVILMEKCGEHNA